MDNKKCERNLRHLMAAILMERFVGRSTIILCNITITILYYTDHKCCQIFIQVKIMAL